MNAWSRFSVGGLLVLGLLAGLPASAQDRECYTDEPRTNKGGLIEWREDIEAALKEAGSTGAPAVLYFSADW